MSFVHQQVSTIQNMVQISWLRCKLILLTWGEYYQCTHFTARLDKRLRIIINGIVVEANNWFYDLEIYLIKISC